ncbi:MAG: hypothetical protein V3T05_11950, partial [Myxococcota bacterium]
MANANPFAAAMGSDRDHRSGSAEFNRVAHQVVEHLIDLLHVDPDLRQVLLDIEFNLDPFSFGLDSVDLAVTPAGLGDVARLERQVELTGFDFG